MGGRSSKRARATTGRYSSFESSTYSYSPHGYPSYAQPSQPYMPPPPLPPQSYGGRAPESKRTLERKYSKIDDNYNSVEQVTEALARAGLESSNLIVGIDFTKSNEWTGARSFHRRSLHHIGDELNPYQQAISIIGRTLSTFDEDNLIPCFGFGDASTHDQEVFSFYPDERFCDGFEEVLRRYRELVPQLRLAGPTSFAPVIEMAITIVEQSCGQYHVLVIIADGQVTRSVDTGHGQLSPQERKTVEAIVKASEYPLSIILVGVGDGPWDMMREFDDNIPARAFDNFQFVNFTEIMSKNVDRSRKEAAFALAALMEIPSQYKATLELNILGASRGKAIDRVPLPPPLYGSAGTSKTSRSSSFCPSAPSSHGHDATVGTSRRASFASDSHAEYNRCMEKVPQELRMDDARDNIFYELFGDDGHGYCRTYGTGVAQTTVYREDVGPSQPKAELAVVEEITRRVAMTVREDLKEELREELREEITRQVAMQLIKASLLSENAAIQAPDASSGHPAWNESVGEDVVSSPSASLPRSASLPPPSEQVIRKE